MEKLLNLMEHYQRGKKLLKILSNEILYVSIGYCVILL